MGDGGGSSFPVVFFDGEREINMGMVKIHPSLEFKNFQLGLSQRIGISANQITVYLVDRKNPKSSPEVRRKIPVTGKANFSAIAREKYCFFLVVLKRRNRRSNQKQGGGGGVVEFADYFQSPEGNFHLLRRNQPEMNSPPISGHGSPLRDQTPPLEKFSSYNGNLQNLQIQRENYAMAMMKSDANWERNSNVSFDLDSFPRIEESLGNNRLFCEVCVGANRKGITAPFHCCVNDPVVVGFRTTAGLIARPPPRRASR